MTRIIRKKAARHLPPETDGDALRLYTREREDKGTYFKRANVSLMRFIASTMFSSLVA